MASFVYVYEQRRRREVFASARVCPVPAISSINSIPGPSIMLHVYGRTFKCSENIHPLEIKKTYEILKQHTRWY